MPSGKNDRYLAPCFGAILNPMNRTIVCHGCDERLTKAATAMRRHASEMHKAIELAKADSVTDELRKEYTDSLIATLHDAQSAWDAYRSHLIEHGLLPALHSRDVA